MDEFFLSAARAQATGNGSFVVIDLSLPEGTVIKPVAGYSLGGLRFPVCHDPKATEFRIEQARGSCR